MTVGSTRTSSVRMAGYDARVTFKSMKRLRVRIQPPDGAVAVSAPHGTPLAVIQRFLADHHGWILENQTAVRLRAARQSTLMAGGRVRVWGAWTEVVVTDSGSASARLVDGRVHVDRPADDPLAAQRAMEVLYRREMVPAVQELLARWEPRVGRRCRAVRLRRMTSRWGSCNTVTGAMTFNTALARFPPEALEYVVVHELVHLLERGHGPAFKHHMRRLLPDWQARRHLLREGP